ncbi:MAG: LamG-like jellyroll fold domain-containing protein, partial [Candidatus Aenigmatarchaeota archaeon]
MVTVQQIQGRKARLFSYSYGKAVPVEAGTVEPDEISTGIKVINRTNTTPFTLKIYGNNWIGVGACLSFKKITVKIRRVGSPAPLVARVVKMKDNTLMEEKQFPNISEAFSSITIEFSQTYYYAFNPYAIGYYVFFYQLGNAGDESNYYELLQSRGSQYMDIVLSVDGGNTFKSTDSPYSLETAGRAIYLNGSNAYGVISHAASLQFSSFTIEFLLKLPFSGNASSDMFIIDKGYDNMQDFWVRIPSGSRSLVAGYGDGSSRIETDTVLNDNNFHYIQIVFDNVTKTLKLYVDNVLKSQAAGVNAVSNSANNVVVGAKAGASSGFANIIFGFLRLYSAALSDADRTNNYRKPHLPVSTNLKTWIHASALKSFGHTSIGANTENINIPANQNVLTFTKFTIGQQIAVKKINIYTYRLGTDAVVARGAIYNDSAGAPGSKIQNSETDIYNLPTSPGWTAMELPQPITLSPGTYWLCVNFGTQFNTSFKRYYDSGTANQYYRVDGSYGGISPTMPDTAPGGGTYGNQKNSVYTDGPLVDFSINNNHLNMFNEQYVVPIIPWIKCELDTIKFDPTGIYLKSNTYFRSYFTPSETFSISVVGVKALKVGNMPVNLQCDVKRVSDNALMGTAYIDVSKLTGGFAAGVLASPVELSGGTQYYVDIKLVTPTGDDDNFIYVSFAQTGMLTDYMSSTRYAFETMIYIGGSIQDTYISQTAVGTQTAVYGNTRVGQTILVARRLNVSSIQLYVSKTGSPQPLVLDIYAVDPSTLKPTGPALTTLETPASNIGTDFAWVSFNINYMF